MSINSTVLDRYINATGYRVGEEIFYCTADKSDKCIIELKSFKDYSKYKHLMDRFLREAMLSSLVGQEQKNNSEDL